MNYKVSTSQAKNWTVELATTNTASGKQLTDVGTRRLSPCDRNILGSPTN
jgi:hypothetical protein